MDFEKIGLVGASDLDFQNFGLRCQRWLAAREHLPRRWEIVDGLAYWEWESIAIALLMLAL